MFKYMTRCITVILCVSMTVPVYAASTDGGGVPTSENEEVIFGSDDLISVEDITDKDYDLISAEGITADDYNESIDEEFSNDGIGSIPSSFDPRKEWPQYITPVRNQGHYGSCWAHGMMFAAEVNLLKNNLAPQYTNETLDLSERVLNHIAYNQDKYPNDYDPLHNSVGEYSTGSMSYDQPTYYDDGGNAYRSGSILQRWMGIVPEKDPYGNPNPDTYYNDIPKSGIDNMDVKYISPKGGNNLAHMENMIRLDKDYKDDVKKYIMKDGALECSYYANSDYLGSDKVSFYCYEDDGADHEVGLVGWDDNYDRKKFNASKDDLPEHNGAWLLRNSWGSDWGDEGYFWLSYEDKSLAEITAVEMAPEDDYDNNYYYAGANYDTQSYGSDITLATVFKVKEEGGLRQQLRAVSFAFDTFELDYDVKIYKGRYEELIKNPSRGSDYDASAKGYREYPGVYTIKLDRAVDLEAGEAFSVVIGLRQEYGGAINLFIEKKAGNSFVNQHPGEAYLDNNGSGVLVDVSDPAVYGDEALNFRINALTDRIESDAAFDIKGVIEPPEGTAYDPVSRTVSTAFTSDTNVVGSKIVPSNVFQLKYTDGTDKSKVTLTSSDEGIVKIYSDGSLVATGAGRAFITAKYNGTNENITAREISVVVKKEIKPGWFVYEKDNADYWPDNNEIFLRECTNFTAAVTEAGDDDANHLYDWIEYEKDKYAGTFTRVPADAYSLDYSGNKAATDSAKAEIKTPEDSFYYANDRTIVYSIGKYDPWDLEIYFKEGEWNKSKRYYELDYTGKELGKIVSTVEYSDGTEVDFSFLGYYKYDPVQRDYIDGEVNPKDAGMYAALIGVDEDDFKYSQIYQVFEICKEDITGSTVEYKDEYTYTGAPITPSFTIKNKNEREVFADQYTVEVKNNTAPYDTQAQETGDNAPYFVITANENGNYTGQAHAKKWKDYKHPERFYFSILPADLTTVDRTGLPRTQITLTQDPARAGKTNDYAYTGKQVKPAISKVEYFDDDGKNPVTIDPKYYDVVYENNIYPTDKNDMAVCVITGKGPYTGSVCLEFSITDDSQASVTDKVSVSLKNAGRTTYEYTGSPIKPVVVVKLTKADGTIVRELKKNEYTLGCINVADSDDTGAVNAGTWAIAVTPADPLKLNFKTNASTRYTITPRKANKVKITLNTYKITQGKRTDEEYIDYLSSGADPGVKSVKDGRNVIDPGCYQVTLRNNKSCGIATAEFTFSGNYEGTKEVPFQIVGKKISKLKFSKIKDQTVVLNSKMEPQEICPEPGDDFAITDSNNDPVINSINEPVKYEIRYNNNRKVGKASVLVIGRGIYEGTAVLPFKIVKRKVSSKSITVGNDYTKNDIEAVYFIGSAAIPGGIKVIDTRCIDVNSGGETEYKPGTLRENVDYTIKVTDNTKPDMVGKVTVTGIGYYEGKTIRTFDMIDNRPHYDSKRDIAKLVESKALILYDKKLGIDDLRPDDRKLNEVLTRVYTGYPFTPDPELYDRTNYPNENEYKMQPGYDYVIRLKNNFNASADPMGNHLSGRAVPELVIEGIGPNYTGSYRITFEIKQVRLNTSSIKPLWDPKGRLSAVGYAPDVCYSGKSQKPPLHLYYLDTGYENSVYSTLLPELNIKDFTVIHSNNKNVSDAGAKLTIKPKKSGNVYLTDGQLPSLEYRYSIVKGNLADAKIASVSDQNYKGVKVTPKPTVTLNRAKLKEGRDFLYVYSDNDRYGVGSVSIKPVSTRSDYELTGSAPMISFVIK